jgi:hypothetical protein
MTAYPRTTTSPEIRRAYVRGALEACGDSRATPEVTEAVCRDLGIEPDELAVLIVEERKAMKLAPFVPTIFGEAKK